MANNATITWADFTKLTASVDTVKADTSRINAVYHGFTQGKEGTTKGVNIKDVGIIAVYVQEVLFPKNKKTVEFALTAGNSSINYSAIASDTNAVILSSVSVPSEHRDVNYSVHVDSELNSPKKLFGGSNKKSVGSIIRSATHTKDLKVNVSLLFIGFPP